MKEFAQLEILQPGDEVAIVSPAAGAAAMFPATYELGLKRLREEMELIPVPLDHTAEIEPTFEQQTADLHEAFSNPRYKAVIATIGGNSQINLIEHLDADVFRTHPKPFFGYSDNTNFINYLWGLGIPSFYGGSIMTQYGMHGAMDELTKDALKKVLFDNSPFVLPQSDYYTDLTPNWSNPELLAHPRQTFDNPPQDWSEAQQSASGILWGGCMESLLDIFTTHPDRIPSIEQLKYSILILETSEELRPVSDFEKFLEILGDRGIMQVLQGILVGRPKATNIHHEPSLEQQLAYVEEQRQAVISGVRAHNAAIPIVQNLAFGHTDPSVAMPIGQKAHIDADSKEITLLAQ